MIFDDDGYYMASIWRNSWHLKDARCGWRRPRRSIAQWTQYTLEQSAIEARLAGAGVKMLTRHTLAGIPKDEAILYDNLGRCDRRIACAGVISVTARLPVDDLWQALEARGDVQEAGIALAQADRRLLRAGAHRSGGLSGASLRARTGQPHRSRRRAVQARAPRHHGPGRWLDQDDFGSNRSKVINLIDSRKLSVRPRMKPWTPHNPGQETGLRSR